MPLLNQGDQRPNLVSGGVVASSSWLSASNADKSRAGWPRGRSIEQGPHGRINRVSATLSALSVPSERAQLSPDPCQCRRSARHAVG